MKKNITIYDIAKEAEVSPATVSRVITGSARVNIEKSRKIREIIDKYNFQPNALARSLLKKESKTIGIIMPSIDNPFFANIFLETEKLLTAEGYSIILCNAFNIDLESVYLKMLVEKQVDGIIFLGGRINMVRTNKQLADEMNAVLDKVPIVMINGRMSGVDCFKVRSDERAGIFSIIEYLISLGHKDIGLIGGISSITSTSIKHKALKYALKHFGLEYNKDWVIFSGFSIDDGLNAAKTLFSLSRIPTAVIAINDFVAIGAMKYAYSQGIKIPQDISLTGFDDSYLCDIVSPTLTSINHDIPKLTKTAVDMIAGKKSSREKVIETSLTIRQSCSKSKQY
ncbi:MAG: LacI family DNA-binding transcriptional regulator [Clostridiales bacterium]|nr:LacI family DNA-binding transcriptional regulator [Clostridiales bacterium]